jgi:dUTP pyrophosphatase
MSELVNSEDDNESLEDLIRQVQELEDLFGDEEPDYNAVMDMFGIDIKELEDEMKRYESRISINYSLSSEDSVSPSYAYPTDSGFDLHSIEEVTMSPFGRSLVSTGLFIDIPEHYEIQVRSKSGLSLKQGLMVLNSPGTVDQGYTGEIKVILFNTNNHEVVIKKGQKIAQAVVSPVLCGKWISWEQKDKIEDKDRSDNGFGSTGI